ncbi:MAG TPA: hypothetical protein VFE47_09835 [Tepidisphaeraceae bacterium]|nr:hypothetical protein [Tepidisphaeraceae bacterium]
MTITEFTNRKDFCASLRTIFFNAMLRNIGFHFNIAGCPGDQAL